VPSRPRRIWIGVADISPGRTFFFLTVVNLYLGIFSYTTLILRDWPKGPGQIGFLPDLGEAYRRAVPLETRVFLGAGGFQRLFFGVQNVLVCLLNALLLRATDPTGPFLSSFCAHDLILIPHAVEVFFVGLPQITGGGVTTYYEHLRMLAMVVVPFLVYYVAGSLLVTREAIYSIVPCPELKMPVGLGPLRVRADLYKKAVETEDAVAIDYENNVITVAPGEKTLEKPASADASKALDPKKPVIMHFKRDIKKAVIVVGLILVVAFPLFGSVSWIFAKAGPIKWTEIYAKFK